MEAEGYLVWFALGSSVATSTSSEPFTTGAGRFTPRARLDRAGERCGGEVDPSARGFPLERKFMESLLRSLGGTACPSELAVLLCRTDGEEQRLREIVSAS